MTDIERQLREIADGMPRTTMSQAMKQHTMLALRSAFRLGWEARNEGVPHLFMHDEWIIARHDRADDHDAGICSRYGGRCTLFQPARAELAEREREVGRLTKERNDAVQLDSIDFLELNAKLTSQSALLRDLVGAVEGLLSYAEQLELIVYPEATGGTEHDVVEIARAALARAREMMGKGKK